MLPSRFASSCMLPAPPDNPIEAA